MFEWAESKTTVHILQVTCYLQTADRSFTVKTPCVLMINVLPNLNTATAAAAARRRRRKPSSFPVCADLTEAEDVFGEEQDGAGALFSADTRTHKVNRQQADNHHKTNRT